MSKNDEITLLQQFIVAAREQDAPYLYDALMALSIPFEHAIRSDFPGGEASQNAIDATRQARLEIAKLREEINQNRAELAKTKTEAQEAAWTLDRIRRETAELRTAARRLINL